MVIQILVAGLDRHEPRIAEHLSGSDYRIDHAIGKVDCLNKLSSNFNVDILFLCCESDLNYQWLDCSEVLNYIRSNPNLNDLHVIAVIPEGHIDLLIKVTNAGANDYLYQSIDKKSLIDKIEAHKRRQQSKQS